jgi:hypothetical protein
LRAATKGFSQAANDAMMASPFDQAERGIVSVIPAQAGIQG